MGRQTGKFQLQRQKSRHTQIQRHIFDTDVMQLRQMYKAQTQVYVYKCAYIYIYMHIYIYGTAYFSIRHPSAYLSIRYTSGVAFMYAYIHMYIYIYIHIYIHIYMYMYVRIYVRRQMYWSIDLHLQYIRMLTYAEVC